MSWQPLLALPARIMVPLLLLVLTLLAAGVNYAYQVDEYSRTVEASERDRLVERLSVEQARLEIESGLGNRQQVRRQVAALGMRPGTSHAFLVDDDGIVVAALSRTAIGRPFAEALANEPEHVRDGLLGAVGRDASRITVVPAADGRH
jgi:two-component system, NtrC family, sensor kinase